MLNYLGMNILINVGRSDRYNEIQNIVEKVVNPNEKILLREKLAIEIYKDYPLSTLKQVVRNAIGIMGRAHWPLAANFWGYSFKDDFSPEHMSKLKSPIVFLVEIFFNLVYLIIFLFFLVFLLLCIFFSFAFVFAFAFVFPCCSFSCSSVYLIVAVRQQGQQPSMRAAERS